MLEELEAKIDNLFKGRGYDIHSIVKASHERMEGLLCSGGKRKWVDDSSFDLPKSMIELQIALQPHIKAVESKYSLKLKLVFLTGLSTTHQFFIGKELVSQNETLMYSNTKYSLSDGEILNIFPRFLDSERDLNEVLVLAKEVFTSLIKLGSRDTI